MQKWKSPNAQDAFLPIPGVISCTGVTGSGRITCHGQATLMSGLKHMYTCTRRCSRLEFARSTNLDQGCRGHCIYLHQPPCHHECKECPPLLLICGLVWGREGSLLLLGVATCVMLEGGREGGKEGGREGGRVGGREGGREGEREGGREGGREGRKEGIEKGRRHRVV